MKTLVAAVILCTLSSVYADIIPPFADGVDLMKYWHELSYVENVLIPSYQRQVEMDCGIISSQTTRRPNPIPDPPACDCPRGPPGESGFPGLDGIPGIPGNRGANGEGATREFVQKTTRAMFTAACRGQCM